MIWCEVPGCKAPAMVSRGRKIRFKSGLKGTLTFMLCQYHDDHREEL